jgi:hypothetical protein
MSERLQSSSEPLKPIDVRFLPESDLIEMTADIDVALTLLGKAAFDEYMKRRGDVINEAIAAQREGVAKPSQPGAQ